MTVVLPLLCMSLKFSVAKLNEDTGNKLQMEEGCTPAPVTGASWLLGLLPTAYHLLSTSILTGGRLRTYS